MAKRNQDQQAKSGGLIKRLFGRPAAPARRATPAPRASTPSGVKSSAPRAARPAASRPSAALGQPAAEVTPQATTKRKPKAAPKKTVATKTALPKAAVTTVTKAVAAKAAPKAVAKSATTKAATKAVAKSATTKATTKTTATKSTTKTAPVAKKRATKSAKRAVKKTEVKSTKKSTKRAAKRAAKKGSAAKGSKPAPRAGGKQQTLTPAQRRRLAVQERARARRERLAATRRRAAERREAQRLRLRAKREQAKARAAAKRLAAKARLEAKRARAAAAAERAAARAAATAERAAAKAAARAEREAARAAAKAEREAAREAAKRAKNEARLAAKNARLTAKLTKRLGINGRTNQAVQTEDGMPASAPIVFENEIAALAAVAVNGRIPLSEVEKLVERLEASELEEIPDIAAIFTALAVRGIEVDDEIDESELREATAVAAKLIASSSGEADLDAFQQWRRDALSHPILTRAEETELTTRYLLYAKTAKALEAARERLGEKINLLEESAADPEIDASYRATLDEELKGLRSELAVMEEEIERAQALAKAAENQFISYNFRLVVSIANRKHKATGRKGDFMDLVQQGNLGMLEAFRRFDPTKGWKFSTFASWHIQQAVSLWLYEQVGVLRVPTHRWRDARDIDKIRLRFQQNGEEASIDQIAAEMGKTPKKIREILAAQTLTRTGSLDKPVSDEEGAGTLGDLVGDAQADDPGDVAVSEALKTVFADAFERVLDGRERRVLQLRYGVYDSQKQTLEWIGRRMNITRERVRQIEERALAKLRKDREVREIGDGRLSRERLGEGS